MKSYLLVRATSSQIRFLIGLAISQPIVIEAFQSIKLKIILPMPKNHFALFFHLTCHMVHFQNQMIITTSPWTMTPHQKGSPQTLVLTKQGIIKILRMITLNWAAFYICLKLYQIWTSLSLYIFQIMA